MNEPIVSDFPRIYQAIPLALNEMILLDERASHYLAHVLRVQKGDRIILFNGLGGEWEASIAKISKKQVTVNMLSYSSSERESPLTLTLAQGIARGEKMDLIIQKATELGVKNITPLITERCNLRWHDDERVSRKLNHWQSVAISACEQSLRNRIPVISAPLLYSEWLPKVKAEKRILLLPHGKAMLSLDAQMGSLTPTIILLLVGPEGGLTQQEIEAALNHGFLPLNLGPRVLRTETASIASMAIVQYFFGDMRHISR